MKVKNHADIWGDQHPAFGEDDPANYPTGWGDPVALEIAIGAFLSGMFFLFCMLAIGYLWG